MGIDGAPGGANGGRPHVPAATYLGSAIFIIIMMTVSALTAQHDGGRKLPAWKPFVTEYSAGVMILVLMPAVAFVTVRTPFAAGRWLRFLLVHFVGSVVFSGVAVGGFVLLRKLIFASLNQHYVFGSVGELVYEYRKLILAYSGMAVVFYLTATLKTLAPSPPGGAEATFDILDGMKLIRAPVGEISSASSAGNYVEFRLADGRRPLMRITLSSVEEQLSPYGFLRTHRSWLVNPHRLRLLEPEGSGDWRIFLDDGTQAPLSRRFPLALEALRRQ